MLAANIGAGSTVGATSRGYLGGIAAWWWVGSAAIGSLALALWIGPAMRRVAAARGLRTVGDYLEDRYDSRVRAIVAALLWIGSLFILSAQLTAIGWILNVVAGTPRAAGCILGGIAITVYFTAGGLLTTAWVNVVQLTVKLAGFAIALPLALSMAGGWSAVSRVRGGDAAYWTFWRADAPGLLYLVLLVPAFIVSPGLLQKIFGARDDRAVRIGVGLNAARAVSLCGRSRRPRDRRPRPIPGSGRREHGAAHGADVRGAAARRARSASPPCSRPRSAPPTPSSSCWPRHCPRISTSGC